MRLLAQRRQPLLDGVCDARRKRRRQVDVAKQLQRRLVVHFLQGDHVGVGIEQRLRRQLPRVVRERRLGGPARDARFGGIGEYVHADAVVGRARRVGELEPRE